MPWKENIKIESCPYGTEYMKPRNEWDELDRKNHFTDRRLHGNQGWKTEASYMAYYQFYFTETILKNCNIPFKLLHCHSNGDISGRDIFTPHADLEYVFAKCEKAVFSPLSKTVVQEYHKSKLLYDKLLSVENDDEKWFEVLKEANDDFFIQQNIEFRIGKDMSNKKLWKLYIAYLKEHNSHIMLQTYSKYCRFWLDDTNMRLEYENQVSNHTSFDVPWTNLFFPSVEISFVERLRIMLSGIKPPQFKSEPFEKHSDDFADMICDSSLMFENIDRLKQILPDKILNTDSTIHYSKENMIFQTFPYCSTMMKFILKNASANVLQKLFKSCKEFFSKQPTPVCYKLTLQNSCHPLRRITYFRESLIIGDEIPSTIYDGKNLVIRTRLWVSSNTFPKMLSFFIPNIYQCYAKFIEIYHQDLTKKEFEFLTKNGTVEELILINVKIMEEDEKCLPLQDILKMVVTSVRMIEISNSNLCTFHTVRILSQLPFKNKIQRFYLWEVNILFDPDDFCKFIEKNAATNCKLKICFKQQISRDFKIKFFKAINETISKKWKHPYFHPVCIPDNNTGVELALSPETDPMWTLDKRSF